MRGRTTRHISKTIFRGVLTKQTPRPIATRRDRKRKRGQVHFVRSTRRAYRQNVPVPFFARRSDSTHLLADASRPRLLALNRHLACRGHGVFSDALLGVLGTLALTAILMAGAGVGRAVSAESPAAEPPATKESNTEMSKDDDKEMSPAAQQKLLKIARTAMEAAVRGEHPSQAQTDDPELKLQRGAFVTLTHGGQLRGCIGEFEAKRPVAEVVHDMAIAAAT